MDASSTNDDADYEEEGELDDEGLYLSSRILFNLYLDENNQAPIDLAQFSASDFDMLSSSQGLRFELLVPSLPFKVLVLIRIDFYIYRF